MSTEVGSRASFSRLRYAQCWEDADILLEALQIGAKDVCFSIASAGDNALSMLSQGPDRVIAVDISPVQLACLELRVAACRELEYDELLRLVGSRAGGDRVALYRRCRGLLSPNTRRYWDDRMDEIGRGIGDAGRFEGYFRLFRKRVLPLVHRQQTVEELVKPKAPEEREVFYNCVWNNRRWRWMFRLFFSRFAMGRLGRDPSFFRYVEGSVSDRILLRTRHALTVLDPSTNPYLQWILFGEHRTALPHWLRPDNVERIRRNLDRLEWREQSIEDFLRSEDASSATCYNLSDVFEYMSTENHADILSMIARAGVSGARVVYWNMLAPRSRPSALADRLEPLESVARKLFVSDKAFFYSALVVEQVLPS